MSISPLLSIITVSAFDEKRLLKTIKSIGLIPMDVEHVVVVPKNDYNSIEMMNDVRNSHQINSKLVHDNNSGVYEAMNIGVSQASGEYVCFWNAGDELMSMTALLRLSSFIRASSLEWYIVQCNFGWRNSQILTLKEVENFALQKYSAFISHQSVFVQRNLFIKMGGFSIKYKVAADTDQITKLFINYNPVFFHDFVVDVEIPNFASQHHRRARIEVLFIALRNLRGRQRLVALKNIFISEALLLKNKFGKS